MATNIIPNSTSTSPTTTTTTTTAATATLAAAFGAFTITAMIIPPESGASREGRVTVA